MRIRLIGEIAALAIALGALAFPSAEPAQAGSTSCTGWTSSTVPPTSIRVYRTATKRTESVPFRTYVEKVMAAEWGATAPVAALEAGAVAAKQFAWYYARAGHWRGGKDAAGRCYDVSDSSHDQVYDPRRTAAASLRAAVQTTWRWSVLRSGSFILTGYRPGTGRCLATVTGYHLYQRDAWDCAKKGWSALEILRAYYGKTGSSVGVVLPGRVDSTGDAIGDAVGITTAADGTYAALLLEAGATGTKATFEATSSPPLGTLGPATVLGRGIGDVTGDGRADVVQLLVDPSGPTPILAVQVMAATGSGFADAVTWWDSTRDAAVTSWRTATWWAQFDQARIRFAVGDVDGDRRADSIITLTRPPAEDGTPWAYGLVQRSSGGSFLASAPRFLDTTTDLTGAALRAGDVSGDGRADLVFVRPTAAGVAFSVAVARRGFTGMEPLAGWGTYPIGLERLKLRLADATRDGRDDIVLAYRRSDTETGLRVRPSTGAAFAAGVTWNGPLAWDDLLLAATDYAPSTAPDGDADVYVLVRVPGAAEGDPPTTDVRRFYVSTTAFTASTWRTALPANWDELAIP